MGRPLANSGFRNERNSRPGVLDRGRLVNSMAHEFIKTGVVDDVLMMTMRATDGRRPVRAAKLNCIPV